MYVLTTTHLLLFYLLYHDLMYYRIEDRMAKELKLSWNELLIYGVIYSSQNQTYVWWQTYLSEITWMSVATIKRSLKWMIENKLITKVSKWYQIVSNWYLKVSEWAIWEEKEKYQIDTSIAQNDTKKVSNWATYINTTITENIKEEIKEEKIEEKKPVKKRYLDFVLLTDEEYSKLLNIFGQTKLNQAIENLNNYIGSKGKRYASHYHTIRKRNQEFIQEQEKRKKELNTKTDLPSEEWLLWTITLQR